MGCLKLNIDTEKCKNDCLSISHKTTDYQLNNHQYANHLRNLNLHPNHKTVKETIEMILSQLKAQDGGIQLGPSTAHNSDICVNGMFLNYASYFNSQEKDLQSVVDNLLKEVMHDGGFNCRTTRSGAKHSSLHSTISVLEGLLEFQRTGFRYRENDILKAIKRAEEFILVHKLFLSDITGKIIHKDFLKLSYPSRWKYDILRALDYFQFAQKKRDNRMEDAIKVILNKRNKDGLWNMQAAHPGEVHFPMEKAGKSSRWNTLRAMRVLKWYNWNIYSS